MVIPRIPYVEQYEKTISIAAPRCRREGPKCHRAHGLLRSCGHRGGSPGGDGDGTYTGYVYKKGSILMYYVCIYIHVYASYMHHN